MKLLSTLIPIRRSIHIYFPYQNSDIPSHFDPQTYEPSMSAADQATAAIAAQLAFSGDGAFLGIALAYVAIRSFSKFVASSSALRKIKDAPSVQVSDLRSIINDDAGTGYGEENVSEVLVVVRGMVESRSAFKGGSWKSLWNGVLQSRGSGERGVIVQRLQQVLRFYIFGVLWKFDRKIELKLKLKLLFILLLGFN